VRLASVPGWRDALFALPGVPVRTTPSGRKVVIGVHAVSETVDGTVDYLRNLTRVNGFLGLSFYYRSGEHGDPTLDSDYWRPKLKVLLKAKHFSRCTTRLQVFNGMVLLMRALSAGLFSAADLSGELQWMGGSDFSVSSLDDTYMRQASVHLEQGRINADRILNGELDVSRYTTRGWFAGLDYAKLASRRYKLCYELAAEAAADLGVALSRRAREKASGPSPDGAAIVQDLRDSLRHLDGYLKTARLGEKTPPWTTQDPIRVEPDSVALTRVETAIALGDELEGAERTELYQSALADSDKMLALELSGIDKARAHYTRGVALRMQDQLLPAVDAFTEAIQAWPSLYGAYSEAHLRRGICYYHLGEYGEALQDFDAAAAMANNPYAYEPRAMLWAGMTQVKQGDMDAAIRSYTRAVTTAPSYVPSLINRGLAYLHQGRYQAAVDDFDTVLRLDPHHADALAYRKLASDRLVSQP